MQTIAHRRKDGEVQTVQRHLIDVADITAELCEKFGAPDAGRIIGLLHDFGKYSTEFQAYIKSANGELDKDDSDYVDADALKGKIDHSSAGAQYVWRHFSKFGSRGEGALIGQILALCIASHHSGLIDCFDKNSKPIFNLRMRKPEEATHLAECKASADMAVMQALDHVATGEACTNLFQYVIQISQSTMPLEKTHWFNLGFFTRLLFSTLIDADRLNSAEFENPRRLHEREARSKHFDWLVAKARVERFIAEFPVTKPIDHLRQSISEQCLKASARAKGAYTLTVPTGGGKTLASLRFAIHHADKHGLDRIIFIAPYTSIIEQNAAAVRDAVEHCADAYPWVLEHHSNLEPEKQTWQSKMVADSWDSPIVFTTMVQFLEACFGGGTRGVRRLHQLCQSVVIFDEAQTLPVNCTHLFCNALNYLVDHGNSTTVLCTATQPLFGSLKHIEKGVLKLSENSEIVNEPGQLFADLNRVDIVSKIKQGGWIEGDVAELVLAQFEVTGSCLVIVNTKAWARTLYDLCSESVLTESLFHLSTNQCPAHRKELLARIRERLANDQPVLCISTQLIEAGVDVSFTTVIRFLAGLDSIAQAAGRCNRHGEAKDEQGRSTKGQVVIVNPEHETTEHLTDIERGKEATLRVLHDGFENLVAPEAIQRYFKYYFYDRADDMDYRLTEKDIGRSDTLLNLLSDNCCSQRTYSSRYEKGLFPLLSQSFKEAGRQFKAIDAPTHAVLVPHGEGKEIINALCAVDAEFDAATYYQLIKRSQRFSVNVFPNVWASLNNCGDAIFEAQPGLGIYWLSERYYDNEFGLSDKPIGLMDSCVL